jgi:hypothetical protein
VSISVILVNNAIIFIVIGILREDPLPTGMLDVFLQKIRSCVSFCLREFIYSKFAPKFRRALNLAEVVMRLSNRESFF